MRSGLGVFLAGTSAWIAAQDFGGRRSTTMAFAAEVATAADESGKDIIDTYMSKMTLEQKINQMVQIDYTMLFGGNGLDEKKLEWLFGQKGFGSILILDQIKNTTYMREMMKQVNDAAKKYGMPPIIAGMDSVHGANYLPNAVIFPQQLNMAATFDPKNAKYAGKVAARDTLAGGVNWIYSPILGLGIKPIWPRMFETFGEDPHVVGQFGIKIVEGIQENNQTAACAKHFVGYSDPYDGHDRAPSWIPTRHLYQYFVRPWRDVVDNAKPLTVMESYTEYDGVANVANRNSLRELLREDLGFEGVLVTDYHEVENLFEFHHDAADNTEAIKMTLSEGSVDVAMLPFHIDRWTYGVLENLNKGSEKSKIAFEKRIERSVRRILELKKKLGMFEESKREESSANLEKIGNAEDRMTALKMARESIVLAKNQWDRTLPITSRNDGAKVKVHVTGPSSDSIRRQSGGWTIYWHGADSDNQFSYGTTVLQAAENRTDWDVTSSCGVSCDEVNATTVKAQRAEADYIVVCIGEDVYSEKSGDIRDLKLPQSQGDFVNTLRKENPKAKIVLVYFGGRPRLLGNMVEDSDAVLIAFLPGPDAGQAVVDLISGDDNFSAKLPVTYPKYEDMSGVPYWHAISDECPLRANICDVEFEFGHGLSYTSFRYSNLQHDSNQVVYSLPWSNSTALDKSTVTFSVDVENTGWRTGMETVMFFIYADSRHTTPEYKRLVHFEKIELQKGEKKTVTYDLTPNTLKYIGPHDDKHDVLQMNEKFRIGVGPHTNCRLWIGTCTDDITLKMRNDEIYDPACERACTLLDEKSCLGIHSISSKECYETCLFSPSDESTDLNGWGWNYVNCIESVLLDERRSDETKCDDVSSLCRNVFATIDKGTVDEKVIDATVIQKVSRYETAMSFLPGMLESWRGLGISVCVLYTGVVLYKRLGGNGQDGSDPLSRELPGENTPLVV